MREADEVGFPNSTYANTEMRFEAKIMSVSKEHDTVVLHIGCDHPKGYTHKGSYRLTTAEATALIDALQNAIAYRCSGLPILSASEHTSQFRQAVSLLYGDIAVP